jgi:hypothetical protein
MQRRPDNFPEAMRIRRETIEHPFGTIKFWMGSQHFQMRTLKHVATEMSLHVLAYNMKRVIKIIGIVPLMQMMGPEKGNSVVNGANQRSNTDVLSASRKNGQRRTKKSD